MIDKENLPTRERELERLLEELDRLEYERNELAQKISALKNQIHAERDFEFQAGDGRVVYGWVDDGLALEIQTPETLKWEYYKSLDVRFAGGHMVEIYGSHPINPKLLGRAEDMDLTLFLLSIDFTPLFEKDSQ